MLIIQPAVGYKNLYGLESYSHYIYIMASLLQLICDPPVSLIKFLGYRFYPPLFYLLSQHLAYSLLYSIIRRFGQPSSQTYKTIGPRYSLFVV